MEEQSEDDRTRLRRRFTVDFNYNSNHLEGNTLTYGQTEILLLFGKVIGEAELKDIIPFHKYMNSLMTEEIENDVLVVQKMLARLQEKRYVERDDKGGWRVFITPSV